MAETPRCVVLGGGGHARVVIDCLRESGAAVPAAIVDADESLWGRTVLDVTVIGGDDRIGEAIADGVTTFVVGLGTVGSAAARRRLFAAGLAAELAPVTVRHPSAVCSQHAVLGDGCQLLPGSIVNAGVRLGRNVIVNSGAIVEHDCEIGDHVHLATGARLTGTVFVADGAMIGAGAVIRNDIRVGADAVVGAGAVVVEDVAAGMTVAGVPAKPI